MKLEKRTTKVLILKEDNYVLPIISIICFIIGIFTLDLIHIEKTSYAGLIGFGIFGVLILLFWKETRISFDNLSDWFEFKQKWIILRKEKSIKKALNGVLGVEYFEYYSTNTDDSNNTRTKNKELKIVFHEKIKVKIYDSSNSINIAEIEVNSVKDLGVFIADFLKVPFKQKTEKEDFQEAYEESMNIKKKGKFMEVKWGE